MEQDTAKRSVLVVESRSSLKEDINVVWSVFSWQTNLRWMRNSREFRPSGRTWKLLEEDFVYSTLCLMLGNRNSLY